MSNVKLLPCPFCGESRDENDASTFGLSIAKTRVRWVQCCTCGGEGPSRGNITSLKTKKAAIAAWNTRPAPAITNRDEAGHGLKQELMAARDRLKHLPPLDLSRLYESPDTAPALTPKQAAADEMFDALAKMDADDAFADLCATIGDEPEWLHIGRAALAKAGQP